MSVRSMERAEQHWPEEFMSCFMQSPEVLTRFFLMEQFLIAENSFWYPYIRMLPQPADDALDTPMFYTSEDCAWIRGTNLEGARKARLGQWKQEYQKAVDLLKSSDMSRYELLRENWRELYIWAATILTSRCFSSNAFALDNMEPKYISNVSTPEQRLPLTFPSPTVYPVLLPVLDFGNHDPSAGVYWKMQGSSYSFIVNETLKNGKEICISYDNKGNEERKSFIIYALTLLVLTMKHTVIMGYGFSLFNNPKDAFRLLLKSTATSRNLTKARDMQQELQQHQIETSPGPSASHGLDEPLHTKHTSTEACSAPPAPLPSCSPDIFLLYPADSTTSFVANNLPLIDTFSILVANARELRTISISPTRITIPSPLHPPTHNLLRLSSLLLTELSRKHSAITTHTPSLPLYPTTTRQFHAARYRRRQLHILATNIHALHTLLHGANTPTTHLLRLEDILAKPASAGQPPNQLRAAIHHILRTRSPHRIRALGHEDLVFTLWLCAEWLRREPLPFDKPATGFRALLRRWLRCLETDYGVPPSGPVVHSLEGSLSGADDAAHGDDDDDDGDERTVIAASYLVVVKAVAETAPGSVFADRRWSVELLQWGLGIVQEEGVVVPGGTDGEEDEFVLFVGQW
ncbi:hypothetical protein MMC26_000151 [Xylographa opegraphella]|nr:hypothetical protein [Xylographa opegraphella]